MSKKFDTYLSVLPLTKVLRTRVNEVIELNTKIKKDKILEIFICEMKIKGGARTYTSLWLFTEKNFIECKDFLTTNDFDLTPYNGKIEYCSLISSDFNLVKASDRSSVKIHFGIKGHIGGDLIATGQNCEKALEIYKKYIIPNLVE